MNGEIPANSGQVDLHANVLIHADVFLGSANPQAAGRQIDELAERCSLAAGAIPALDLNSVGFQVMPAMLTALARLGRADPHRKRFCPGGCCHGVLLINPLTRNLSAKFSGTFGNLGKIVGMGGLNGYRTCGEQPLQSLRA